MAICKLGAYHDVCSANANMIDVFRTIETEKDIHIHFTCVRKIAIEAPPETQFTVNDVDIIMPSTGIFELGFGLIDIYNLVFATDTEANIVYMF